MPELFHPLPLCLSSFLNTGQSPSRRRYTQLLCCELLRQIRKRHFWHI